MIKNILRKILFHFKLSKYKKRNKLNAVCTIGENVSLDNCILNYHSRIAANATLQNVEVGEYTAIGRYSKIVYTIIGKYCAISWDTTINAISHPYNHLSISAFPYVPYVGNFVSERKQTHQNVIIKNDVWIGANSVIMPGITIGNGAIIGAGAVVTKDVPDYAIVVGVPAKIIKYRFSKDIIDRLLELNWWDLDHRIIKENIDIWGDEFDSDSLKRLEEICK
ncbi:MAG: DapH/DapD/GlmU-related protein [Sulfurovum sp.]|nr:DapH/DapD/GlmU-related protein [Sulfurovum sp.]